MGGSQRNYDALLSQAGHRRTVQRQSILQVLEETCNHLTIEQLTTRVQAILPPVSPSTVYRNIELLAEMGYIRANLLPGEGATYELVDAKPHVHLLCQHCHSVTHLDAKQLELLSTQFQAMIPFHVISLALNVTGYCDTCRDVLSKESL